MLLASIVILNVLPNSLYSQFSLQIIPCLDSMSVVNLVDTCLLSNLSSGTYKNITFHGDPRSVGYFYNGYIFGFETERGIAMSTGFVTDIDKSNTCSQQNASSNTLGGGDSDLEQLSGTQINDACIIEFDFKSMVDSVGFNYLFGSEEYHEYVGFPYNDPIGLFLSGPGMTGSFSNNAENIALLTESGENVSMGNVNCGVQQTVCTPPTWGPNCDFLFDNTNNQNPSFNIISLDAYTLPFSASHDLQEENWYHIKITIGDAGDAIYDSGLFLEAGSFFTGIYTSIDDNLQEQKSNTEIYIYPNPAKYHTNIIFSSPKMCIFEVLIFDQFGKQEFRQKYSHLGGKKYYKMVLPNLNPGIHFVKVLTSSGTTKLLKLEVVN